MNIIRRRSNKEFVINDGEEFSLLFLTFKKVLNLNLNKKIKLNHLYP